MYFYRKRKLFTHFTAHVSHDVSHDLKVHFEVV
nr:MAG TPA: hypothetical protein [Caudoviricetes sp.]